MIRKIVFPNLLLLLGVVFYFTVRGAISDPTTRTSNLAAIVSCISAMTAIIVAYWSESRERAHRQEEEARTLDRQSRLRQRLAAVYSSDITVWLNRKDLQDIVIGLRSIESEDSIRQSLKVIKISKRSDPANLTASAEFWREEIRYLNHALGIDTFRRLADLPSIWTTQFTKDDVELLDGGAPDYFITMRGIWSNLVLKALELSSSPSLLTVMREDEADLLPLFVNAVVSDAIELREHLGSFVDAAKEAAAILRSPNGCALVSPSTLLSKSRDSSERLPKVWAFLSLLRVTHAAKHMVDNAKQIGDGLSDILKSHEEFEKSVRASVDAQDSASL